MEEKVEISLDEYSCDNACHNGCQRASGSPTGGQKIFSYLIVMYT